MGPRFLGGPRREGAPRVKWTEAVVTLALRLLTDCEGVRVQYQIDHRERAALWRFALDKNAWNRS
eukprot:1781969-Alexandrium_andersonii.AAC.1